MSAFVSGATGFIGGHLAEHLLSQGTQVTTLARPTSDAARIQSLGVAVVRGQLADRDALERAMLGCDVAYHVAALTSRQSPTRKHCHHVNVEATGRVAEVALRLGIRRMVYVSAAAVYGVIDAPPVDEQSGTNCESPYAESKVLAEQRLLAAHAAQGLPVVIVRFPGVLGRRSPAFLRLFRAIARGGFRVIGPGDNHTHVGHVNDVIQGLRLCGQTPGIEGRIYNLGGERAVAVNELVNLIARELGVELSSTRLPRFPYRALHRANLFFYRHFGRELPRAGQYELFLSDKVMSIAKARRELGFAPRVSVADGIRETIAWHRERGEL